MLHLKKSKTKGFPTVPRILNRIYAGIKGKVDQLPAPIKEDFYKAVAIK